MGNNLQNVGEILATKVEEKKSELKCLEEESLKYKDYLIEAHNEYVQL